MNVKRINIPIKAEFNVLERLDKGEALENCN